VTEDRPGVRRDRPVAAPLVGALGWARPAILGVVLAAFVIAGCSAATSPAPTPAPAATASTVAGSATASTVAGSATASTVASPAVDEGSGLPIIEVVDMPPEALATIALIRAGGPFPYSQDGAVFGNREGLLPAHEKGWYHEYTVETPGSPDRGARRIVTGGDGTFYWTDDHYATFRVIRR
jgi:ribonuclease T1